ncbi:MAG: GNAT family N-acetyltransferase, partial [Kordiimonas sp.]
MHKCLPLKTKRLIIRQFRVEDAVAFYRWRDNATVARYTLWDYPYEMSEAEAFCIEQAGLTCFPSVDWCQLMIEEAATGEAIGDIGLGIRVDGNDTLTLGYSLHPDSWGKGVMYEALSELLPILTSALSVKKVKGIVDARNLASS